VQLPEERKISLNHMIVDYLIFVVRNCSDDNIA